MTVEECQALCREELPERIGHTLRGETGPVGYHLQAYRLMATGWGASAN